MSKRSAFAVFLRTGRRIAEPVEAKFNPWHDPEDGRFTFVGAFQRALLALDNKNPK